MGRGRGRSSGGGLVGGLIIGGIIIYLIVKYWVGILLIALAGLLGYQAYQKGFASKAGKWLAGGAAFFTLAFLGWLGSDEPTNSVPASMTTVSQTSTVTEELTKTETISTASTNSVQPEPGAATATTTPPTTIAATTQQSEVTPARIQAKVTEVVDGDTFKVLVNGKEETVRMLLIDTPETKHPDKPVQPFGPEASQFTQSLLTGKTVELEKDVSERDKYGRLLAYVYVNGQSVQEKLLEKGLARVAVYPPDVKYVDKYREIQGKAQQAGVGIWSIENYAQEDGYHVEVVKKEENKPTAPAPKPQPKPEPQLGQASNKPKLQYDPFGPDRDCGDFASQAEAQAFFEAAGGPAHDPHRLDRDNDGLACEQN